MRARKALCSLAIWEVFHVALAPALAVRFVYWLCYQNFDRQKTMPAFPKEKATRRRPPKSGKPAAAWPQYGGKQLAANHLRLPRPPDCPRIPSDNRECRLFILRCHQLGGAL